MPWDFTYDAQKNLFHIKAKGTVTEKELSEGLGRMMSSPSYGSKSRLFHDYEAITKIELSADFLHELGLTIRSQKVEVHRAFFVRSPLVAGSLAFYLERAATDSIQVFYERQNALAWLNEGQPPEMHVK